MALDGRTAQEQLTPEARRELLRAFADRMLLKISAMDDPEDMPGVERGVRVAAAIERIYSRCDRAEVRAPDPRKLEAERARNEGEAIKARVHLAGTMQWGEARRRALGPWWDAAAEKTEAPAPAAPAVVLPVKPSEPAAKDAAEALAVVADGGLPPVRYVDYTDAIEAARAEITARRKAEAVAKREQRPP